MFSEAYIIFSLGQIKPFQAALYPTCFNSHTDCTNEITHVQNYIQICGIIVGMILFGALADFIGRKWGSRLVASIMLTGCVMLVFSPLISSPATYLSFFIFAQTWYGFGVGGEYPMASSSAAERSQSDPELRNHRGRQVVLTFSQQGMGNLVNGCVILIAMVMFGQTGNRLTADGSRGVLTVQFAVGCAVTVIMVLWRYTKLKESKVWSAERKDFTVLNREVEHKGALNLYRTSLYYFWPRMIATCIGWVANDFAFYGNKLFQNTFISILYPKATAFEKQQWTVLNAAVALMGYFCAAWLVDKKWYGRRFMQTFGFFMMFVLFLICAVAFNVLTASQEGLHAFQFLYFFSSFWNQFGPNATTWLVAAEVYPTDVRATFQGLSAASGKLGAIIADVVFGYVNQQTTFYLSAVFGLVGCLVTLLWLPDTTGLSLDELDRMAKYMLAEEFKHYHGEAINPRYLSLWERLVWKWHVHYDLAQDAKHRVVQQSFVEDSQAIQAMAVFNE
eukprot:jgi/Chrzof1/12613/Cz07g01060.t1